LASMSFSLVRKVDMRWVESKASATDRVIRLVTPIGRGAGAVTTGETVCEVDCLLLRCDESSAGVFLQILIILEQIIMITGIN
jgi:hypothetical protein